MTEQQPYDVVREYPNFELRRYPAHTVAEVDVAADFDSAGSRAFGPLFSYISGGNEDRRKIAMTAPVVQVPTERGHAVAFVMPQDLSAAPAPADTSVRIRTEPERVAAATRYSGRWSRRDYDRRLAELRDAISAAGFTAKGEPRFARFNPPFTPWFLRRNEIVIDVEGVQAGTS
jgi:hypothetical protein